MSKPRIKNNLPQFVGNVQRKAARAMTAALIIGGSETVALTPRNTSFLVNSQYKNVDSEGGRIVGTFGYTAEYALAVHESEGKWFGLNIPRPKSAKGHDRGVYWGPGGEPEFMKTGFENARPNIRAVLIGAIKI